MSLTLPTVTNEAFKVSFQNLNRVINSKEQDNRNINPFITDVAKLCVEDIKNAQVSFTDKIKKHVVSASVHGSLLLAPAATALGGVWYLSKDLTTEKMKNFDSYHALIISAGLGAAFLVDKGIGSVVGVRPSTFALVSMYDAYREIVGRISKEVLSSYNRREDDMRATKADRREKIQKELVTTYTGMADELVQLYTKAQNEPKEMMELKKLVDKFDDKLPFIAEVFAKNKDLHLNETEVTAILRPIKEVINLINQHGFSMRSTAGAIDNKYNAELMMILSNEEFSEKAVSHTASEHFQEAKNNTLGFGHTFKTYANGIFGTLAIPSGIAACSAYLSNPTLMEKTQEIFQGKVDSSQTMPIVAGVTAVGLVAVGAIDIASSMMHQSLRKKRLECEAEVKLRTTAGIQDLKAIYDGIATHLSDGKVSAQDCLKIKSKLDSVERQLKATGIVQNPSEITQKLRAELQKKTA